MDRAQTVLYSGKQGILPLVKKYLQIRRIPMKTMRLLLILGAAAFLFLAVGCSEQKSSVQEEKPQTTAEDVKKEATDMVETAKSYTMEQKQAYEEKLAKELDEYRQKISALRAQMTQAKDSVQKEMQDTMDRLQTDIDAMGNKVDAMKNASGEAWDSLKEGADRAAEDLNQAYSDAMQQMQQAMSK